MVRILFKSAVPVAIAQNIVALSETGVDMASSTKKEKSRDISLSNRKQGKGNGREGIRKLIKILNLCYCSWGKKVMYC